MPWPIKYFQDSDGSVPAADFEDSLPSDQAARLDRWARAVSEGGFTTGGTIFKKCYGYSDLFEIRARVGKKLIREFCIVDRGSLVMLSGVVKGVDEPTPEAALCEAARLLETYKATRRTV